MAGQASRIELLPLSASASIDASLRIRSLGDVVLDLVKNSLDASATDIEIRLDLKKGFCSVLDNGSGICQHEFLVDGGLGRPHHTSKSSLSPSYGQRGCFLATLSAVALVSIFSSSSNSEGVSSLVLRDGQRMSSRVGSQYYPEVGLSGNGTKVLVYNLFGKYPVRAKHRVARYERRVELQKDFTDIKLSLLALLLAAPHRFTFRLNEISLNYRYEFGSRLVTSKIPSINWNVLELDSIISIITEIDGVPKRDHHAQWATLSLSTAEFHVNGAFSVEPVSTRHAQFISIGIEALGRSAHVLFEAVHAVFRQSSYSISKADDQQSGFTEVNNKETADRLRRWPAFYIQITRTAHDFGNDKPTPEHSISAVQAIAFEFVRSHDLCLGQRKRPSKRPHPRSSEVSKSDQSTHTRSVALAARPRIKSAHNVDPDEFVSGLPFIQSMTSAEQLSSAALAAENMCSISDRSQDECFKWMDPRTGEFLTLNSRTGAVHQVSDNPGQIFESLRIRARVRKVEETAQWLRAHCILGNSHSAEEALIRWMVPSRGGCVSSSLANDSRLCSPGTVFDQHAGGEVLWGSRITRKAIAEAQIVGQVDRKFILARSRSPDGEELVILIDQHAADERVRIERLFAAGCKGRSTVLPEPIHFKIEAHEGRLLRSLAPYLSSWGIDVTVGASAEHETTASVSALPEGIAERCCAQPKLLGDLLRREIWTMQDSDTARAPRLRNADGDWLTNITHCPQGILDLLISRACRSAIMFNDTLSTEQMQGVVHNLAQCVFPFQCAHGRPSVVSLMALTDRPPFGIQVDSPSFHEAWSTWD